jgi:hypothetical protein
MDFIKEEIIKRKSSGLRTALIVVFIVGMVFFFLIGFWALQTFVGILFSSDFSWMYKLMLGSLTLVCAVSVYGGWKGYSAQRVEYEYCFINGELDVDMVVNNSRRKKLLTLNMRDVDRGGPVTDNEYARFAQKPGIKTRKYAFAEEETLFYLAYTVNGQQQLLLLEPSADMKDMFRQHNPRNIIL